MRATAAVLPAAPPDLVALPPSPSLVSPVHVLLPVLRRHSWSAVVALPPSRRAAACATLLQLVLRRRWRPDCRPVAGSRPVCPCRGRPLAGILPCLSCQLEALLNNEDEFLL